MPQYSLPKTATAPFCPSEVKGSILVEKGKSFWLRLLKFAGPGLLVSVGYMDPGNWATDIEAGSRYGYSLLCVVLISPLSAILLQYLSLKLGIVSGRDLAQSSRDRYGKRSNIFLWLLAELAITACDLAEVLGSALAFKLLFGCSLMTGIVLTMFDTVLILGLKGKGFRQVEAIILALIMTIGGCYLYELILVQPDWGDVSRGFVPVLDFWKQKDPWYLAIGIVGATVMPHNLYLHSSIVQTRDVGKTIPEKQDAIKMATVDTVFSLLLALFVNAAILILAAAAFHGHGHTDVADIQDAHELLAPVVGTVLASTLFAIALLASGQSSTFTGTIAGQVIFEGYLQLKIPCYLRRILTRGLALIPAFIGVWIMGEGAVGKLLVLSQVVLGLQLPFAIYPLMSATSDKELMGQFANGLVLKIAVWAIFLAITAANLWLIVQVF